MRFSRQEYWSGLPFPSLGDLPDTGIKPRCLALQADSLLSEISGGPKPNDSSLYKRERQTHIQKHRHRHRDEECHVTTDRLKWWCIYRPRNAKVAGNHLKLGERPGTDSPSKSPEATNPAHNLISDFWPPEL